MLSTHLLFSEVATFIVTGVLGSMWGFTFKSLSHLFYLLEASFLSALVPMASSFFFFLILWRCPPHTKVPGSGVEPQPELRSMPQLQLYKILLTTVQGWGSNTHLHSNLICCSRILHPWHHGGNPHGFF